MKEKPINFNQEILTVLDKEIRHHENSRGEGPSENFEKGFLAGLEHARVILESVIEPAASTDYAPDGLTPSGETIN